jgi:uncharacterized peroxidase-related enzyme
MAIRSNTILAPQRDTLSWLNLPPAKPDSPELIATFEKAQSLFGFVRHAYWVMAHKPKHLLTSTALARELMYDPDPHLSERERELLALVVSVENRCDVCVFGHAASLRRITGDSVLVGQIEINYRRVALSARETALCDFAIKVTRAAAEISQHDLQLLRNTGLDELAILEAAHIISYFNMSNRLQSALGITPNPQDYESHRLAR